MSKDNEKPVVVMESRIYSDGVVESKSDLVGFIATLANASESAGANISRIVTAVVEATIKAHQEVEAGRKVYAGICKAANAEAKLEQDAANEKRTMAEEIKDLKETVMKLQFEGIDTRAELAAEKAKTRKSQ